MWTLRFIPFALLALSGFAQGFSIDSEFELTQRNAFRVAEDERLSQNKQTGSIELSGSPNYSTSFTVIGRASFDHYYDQERFNDSEVDDHKSETELREAYVDYFIDNFTIRLGKQQVTWGESDYFRVVDLVHSLDLRDFLLPYAENFQEARNTLNMMNIMHQGDIWETQLLFIPDFQQDTLPSPSADFSPIAYTQLNEQLGMPEHSTPDAKIDNAAWGFSAKGVFDMGDLGFYGYSGWNGDGTLRLSNSGPVFDYQRRQFIGTSFSAPVGAFVLRTDIAHRFNERLNAQLGSGLPYVEKDVNEILMGLDYSHASFNSSVQLVHRKVMDHESTVSVSPESNSFSIYISQELLGDRLKLSYLMLGESDDFNGLNEARMSYQFHDQVIGTIGVNWFEGDIDTTYGQFDQQDRIFTGLKLFL